MNNRCVVGDALPIQIDQLAQPRCRATQRHRRLTSASATLMQINLPSLRTGNLRLGLTGGTAILLAASPEPHMINSVFAMSINVQIPLCLNHGPPVVELEFIPLFIPVVRIQIRSYRAVKTQ